VSRVFAAAGGAFAAASEIEQIAASAGPNAFFGTCG
jgi:hypothetical protein